MVQHWPNRHFCPLLRNLRRRTNRYKLLPKSLQSHFLLRISIWLLLFEFNNSFYFQHSKHVLRCWTLLLQYAFSQLRKTNFFLDVNINSQNVPFNYNAINSQQQGGDDPMTVDHYQINVGTVSVHSELVVAVTGISGGNSLALCLNDGILSNGPSGTFFRFNFLLTF